MFGFVDVAKSEDSKSRSCRSVLSLPALLFVSIWVTGCGASKNPWETAYPAKGTIRFDGKPIAGALIALIPESGDVPGSVRPRAVSSEDGSFEVGTYSSDDGAPEGSYKVIVTHYPVVGTPENPTNGPNDLPQKYSKAETTDLKLVVAAPSTEFQTLELRKPTR